MILGKLPVPVPALRALIVHLITAVSCNRRSDTRMFEFSIRWGWGIVDQTVQKISWVRLP